MLLYTVFWGDHRKRVGKKRKTPALIRKCSVKQAASMGTGQEPVVGTKPAGKDTAIDRPVPGDLCCSIR